ncbi:DUF427 domain-containing protein [Sphingomonas sp. SFZ2018-12]|uniref:DUF427 domain-containing protein n=1 Tax=Sphingomonas sp. SFZ2018-12 TaxID=2683197 RepID=UPI001F110FFD|nr:DUF427 domain-containing protein [Sphingomonas sp. SFZ2018-12]MCH4893851.1 DUF427 domain-containing protein [Sphingomonas sp. SFZ2018-12]
MNRPTPDPVGPGQESVWDYPRPPIVAPARGHVVIQHRGVTVADTRAALRTLETSHPPTYYLPPDSVAPGLLRTAAGSSFCEWKGWARYFDLVLPDETVAGVAWSYPDPTRGFAALRDHLAFYAAPLDAVTIDGEQVTPQPGGFYGGWITRNLAGPFKGVPGSRFW